MERNIRKQKIGVVTSNKMDKTIVVAIERKLQQKKKKKGMKQTIKFKAHDENNECNIGDIVKIMQTRPISKQKRWRLVEILERVK